MQISDADIIQKFYSYFTSTPDENQFVYRFFFPTILEHEDDKDKLLFNTDKKKQYEVFLLIQNINFNLKLG